MENFHGNSSAYSQASLVNEFPLVHWIWESRSEVRLAKLCRICSLFRFSRSSAFSSGFLFVVGAGNPKMMAKVSLKRQLIFTSQKLFLFENLLRLVSSSTYNLLDFISLVKKKQFMITERPQNCRFNKCLTEIWGNFNTPTFPLQLAYSDHINFMNSPLFTIVSL